MKASALAVLWVLCASVATAAPAHHRGKPRVCSDAWGAPEEAASLIRRSVGGPVAPPSTRALAGLADPTLLMQRARSDTMSMTTSRRFRTIRRPRASTRGLRLAPAFAPIGVLARIADRLPKLASVFAALSSWSTVLGLISRPSVVVGFVTLR